MCGRYRLSRRKQIIAEHFDATPFDEDWGATLQHCPIAAVSSPRTRYVFWASEAESGIATRESTGEL